MARVAPASCSFWAMPQAMERLLASPKTTAVLPARSIMRANFLQGPCLGEPDTYYLNRVSERFSNFRGFNGSAHCGFFLMKKPLRVSRFHDSAIGEPLSRPDPRVRPCLWAALKSGSRGARIFRRNRWRSSGRAQQKTARSANVSEHLAGRQVSG